MRIVFFVLLLFIVAVKTHAQPVPYRIMPLGDSITQSDVNHNSYRRPLWKLLQAAYIPVDFVGSLTEHFIPRLNEPPNPDFDMDHEGHAAWRTDEILAQLPVWAQSYQPDVVLVHLGTNDIMAGQSYESTRDELGQIIDVLRAENPNVIILLAQIIPYDFPPEANVPPVDGLNVLLPHLVAQKNTPQSPVYLVDLHTGFDVVYDLEFDRVHPTVSGENLMALRWFETLKQILYASSGGHELINNGGFELKNQGWQLTTALAKCNTERKKFAYEGNCAFRFRANDYGMLLQASTLLPNTIVSGNMMTLSVFARTTGEPNVKLRAFVNYVDGTHDKIVLRIIPSDFYIQQIAPSLRVSKPPVKLKIKVKNFGISGMVLLDNLSLVVYR